MDIFEFSIVARFWPFSSILGLLVPRRSTEEVHAVPKTEPSEMGTVITRKRSDGSTGYQAQLLIKRAARSCVGKTGRSIDDKLPLLGSKSGRRNLPNPARSSVSKRRPLR